MPSGNALTSRRIQVASAETIGNIEADMRSRSQQDLKQLSGNLLEHGVQPTWTP
ncbi:hypothetical protein XM38_015710 [Halomicronema hongdechloris C2206]|uniref:Uncharacterized protein n=1 Tax=Halomicronema hongdechloris C2206 TaxID=1641165 RepID=A0A1Z3HJZ5_9CYAN|nr:hypothetical protein XM38_015710 [Halomicronema hongdechloris C2206]